MPVPRVRASAVVRASSRLPAVGLALALVLVPAIAGCDAGSPDPGPTGPTTASTATSSTPTTAAPSSPTAATTPASPPGTTTVTGPATPTAPPGTFAIAVAGAGQVTYPVTGVRCAGTSVSGTATPADGGAAGTVTLDTSAGTVTVSGLPPLDGTRLSGTVDGAPAPGAEVGWTGDGTGSAASLRVTCP